MTGIPFLYFRSPLCSHRTTILITDDPQVARSVEGGGVGSEPIVGLPYAITTSTDEVLRQMSPASVPNSLTRSALHESCRECVAHSVKEKVWNSRPILSFSGTFPPKEGLWVCEYHVNIPPGVKRLDSSLGPPPFPLTEAFRSRSNMTKQEIRGFPAKVEMSL